MKIKVTSIYVDDQEKALRFYTEVLGFAKKNDFSQGPYRWLTVASPEEPDGTELQLALNNNPAAKTYQQAIFEQKQPAANFFMGAYYAESLLLAEPGAATGAIQIAGTDSDHQLPFFITSCDYTLIGEELYAASAYLSREPVLVGTLRGQDIGKGVFLGAIVVGTLLVTLGELLGTPVFQTFFQVFTDFK